MERWTTAAAGTEDRIGVQFVILGLVALAASLPFGVLGAFKFLYPDFLEALPFHKIRPLHVSLAVAWIFLAAIGGIYHYLPNFCRLALFSGRAARLHLWIFLATGLAVLGCYLAGRFGGREYLEFPPVLSLPILIGWVLFGVNFFATVAREREPWPVHYWMWGTGIVFFFLTLSEAQLWVLPFFRDSMVREITVQWKSYGALIGSWNMLVYGTAIFLMERIGGDRAVARSRLAFGLYFLGLFNLMFGWAHHAYPVPLAAWIRDFAYGVSMTELLILGKMIWSWRSSVSAYRRFRHRHAYRFLFASELWIFLNLALALVISVPAANLVTHGTHVTVAHAMGTTIGINTMILLASVLFMIEEKSARCLDGPHADFVATGFWLANLSLLVVWLALIAAGVGRGTYSGGSFQDMMEAIRPYLLVFAAVGVGLMAGLWMVLLPALHLLYRSVFPGAERIGTTAFQRE